MGADDGRSQVDNGTEFPSLPMDRWAYWNGMTLDFSHAGRPQDSALAEALNSRFRRECLNDKSSESAMYLRRS
ncbi:MAG: hypothetical protein ACE149_19950 [Armatimonadota bacterium]